MRCHNGWRIFLVVDNAVEGFHSKVNKGIRSHQSIFLLIKFIRTLHSSTLIDIGRIKKKAKIKV